MENRCVYYPVYHCRRFYNGFLTFQGDRALFFAALQPPISRTEFTRDEFPGLLPESASSSSAKSSGYGAMYRAILPFLKNRCKGWIEFGIRGKRIDLLIVMTQFFPLKFILEIVDFEIIHFRKCELIYFLSR